MLVYLIPIFVLAGLLLLLGIFIALSRFRGGRYVRPIVQTLARVGLFRRLMVRASKAAMERENPELASAMRKLERSGALRDPARAQRALTSLSAAERRAYLDAVAESGNLPAPSSRAERRARSKMQKRR